MAPLRMEAALILFTLNLMQLVVTPVQHLPFPVVVPTAPWIKE
jgi:hypothetical protein